MTQSRRWYLILGSILVGAVLLAALLADRLTLLSPHYMDVPTDLLAPKPPLPPGGIHPLGTDEWGRDIWSRLLHGTRLSLLFAFLIMSLRLLTAIPAAFAATYGPRWAAWLVDQAYVITAAFPPLLVYLFILSVPRLRLLGFWQSVGLTLGLVTLLEWPRLAVVLKGRLEELTREPFVEGAIAAGATRWRILTVHLLPHLWPTILHMVAAEMGRGLLTIAHLGLFGIWVGGGIVEKVPAGMTDRLVNIPGMPEWGTMLASSRTFIRTAPWIPLAPATAFFIGVVGFNLLSQGLEALPQLIGRWRAAREDRPSLRRRWRWLLPAAAALALLWHFQGLPWGREAGIHALAARQQAALTAGDLPAFAATIDPQDPDYRKELSRIASHLLERPADRVAVTLSALQLQGSRASAQWQAKLTRQGTSPEVVTRPVALVRRWGRWYEVRDGYSAFPTLHTDLEAVYDPNDSSEHALSRRKDIRLLARVLDDAHALIDPLLPTAAEEERPRVRVYRTHWDFLDASLGAGLTATQLGNYAISPGEALRVSPNFAADALPEQVAADVRFQLLAYLTHLRLDRETLHPTVAGFYRLAMPNFRPVYSLWENQPLLSLADLFATPIERLPVQKQSLYLDQAALLVELLTRHISPAELQAHPERYGDPAAVAAALGMTEAELSAAYQSHLIHRVVTASGMHRSDRRPAVPEGLLQAVDERAQQVRRTLGLAAYQTDVLAVRTPDAITRVQVLEQVREPDGETHLVVTTQEWFHRSGRWLCFHTFSPLLAGRFEEEARDPRRETAYVPQLSRELPVLTAARVESLIADLQPMGYSVRTERAAIAETEVRGAEVPHVALAWPEPHGDGQMLTVAIRTKEGAVAALRLPDAAYPIPWKVGFLSLPGRTMVAVVTKQPGSPGSDVYVLEYDPAGGTLRPRFHRTAGAGDILADSVSIAAVDGRTHVTTFWIWNEPQQTFLQGSTATYIY